LGSLKIKTKQKRRKETHSNVRTYHRKKSCHGCHSPIPEEWSSSKSSTDSWYSKDLMSTSYFGQIPGKNKEEKKILLNRNVIGEKEASVFASSSYRKKLVPSVPSKRHLTVNHTLFPLTPLC
jgi:hypothetical protein